MRCARFLPVLVVVCLASPAALAWSALGHRTVGQLAERQLPPATRRQVRALLAGEPEPTLAGVAVWADDQRAADPQRATARWHYVNVTGAGCTYDPPRDCPDGQCVVGALEAQRAILADRARPLAQRRDALKFIVHLIGDAHQPLHAGSRDDKGGNRYPISLRTDLPPPFFARARYSDGVMGTNLHAVWDYYILATPKRGIQTYADRVDVLQSGPAAASGDPVAWAQESCRIAQGIYPQGHKMDRAYLDAERPLAQQRIRDAALRLSRMLDATLNEAR